jgi:hypothetical protein
MRLIINFILLILLTHSGHGQTFLDEYKKYRLDGVDTLSKLRTRKKVKSYIKSHVNELDTVFQSYKAKTGFDFKAADTIFLIYDSPAESVFASDIIIWSGKDTVSYRQGFEKIKPFKYKRVIKYAPFIPKVDRRKGFKVVTERDSILTLVSKRDYATINHLGDNQSINGGSLFKIYVAYKNGGQYKFETCFPKQFVIRDVYRKE